MRQETKIASVAGWTVDIDIDVAGAISELRARADQLEAGEIGLDEVVLKSVVLPHEGFTVLLPVGEEVKLGISTPELQKLMRAAGLGQHADRLANEVFKNTDDQLINALAQLEAASQLFSSASYLERLIFRTTYEIQYFEDQAILLESLKDIIRAEVKRRSAD